MLHFILKQDKYKHLNFKTLSFILIQFLWPIMNANVKLR